MNKFFSEELKEATDEHCKARWSCGSPGEYFRCGFCGHKFKVGDKWRALYTNNLHGAPGNPLVCEACNAETEILRARWLSLSAEWSAIRENPRFWWFNKRLVYA